LVSIAAAGASALAHAISRTPAVAAASHDAPPPAPIHHRTAGDSAWAGSLADAYKAIRGQELSRMPIQPGADLAESARSEVVVRAMREPEALVASGQGISGAFAAYRDVMSDGA
jgi:hypothetical protein